MTHEGPYGSATSRNHYYVGEKNVHHAGSSNLRDLLIENQAKVVCNIHGHCHEGAFTQNIHTPSDPLKIINPGALGQKEFGHILIERDMLNKWKVTEACKFYL
jgi:Icc-related predicted phosphoesterase